MICSDVCLPGRPGFFIRAVFKTNADSTLQAFNLILNSWLSFNQNNKIIVQLAKKK
jgi:hypothetical protein